MSNMYIFLLDSSNNTKEEINIIKPKSYQELLIYLRLNLKTISDNFEIFILDKDNKEIIINNEENYKIIEDILFIREIKKDILEQSFFEKNYNKLSDSIQEILDEKYNCNICSTIIKKEKPYLCYKCQKIFHEKCLKDWDEKCKSQNKNLECPNCRNLLPIEFWNKKLDYEDKRNEDANLMDKINKLKEKEITQIELIKKYERYIDKTIEIFKIILNKINSIHTLLKLENNNKLNNFINKYPLNINNLFNIDEISNIINEELDKFKIYYNNINKDLQGINLSKENKIIENNIENNENKIINNNNINEIDDIHINQLEENFNEIKINEYENRINLKYFVNTEGYYNIFGKNFIENNKNNIDLYINRKKHILMNNVELKEGENIITIIIKNKLINLSYMFYMCDFLRDISELKYLDVSESTDFSYMFHDCLLLSDINALKKWNVLSCKSFSYMFSGCSLLSNIEALKNWKVHNCKNFSFMFFGCSTLSDIEVLSNWNVSSDSSFSDMFSECSLLSDLKPIENWNISENKRKDMKK